MNCTDCPRLEHTNKLPNAKATKNYENANGRRILGFGFGSGKPYCTAPRCNEWHLSPVFPHNFGVLRGGARRAASFWAIEPATLGDPGEVPKGQVLSELDCRSICFMAVYHGQRLNSVLSPFDNLREYVSEVWG